MGAIKLKTGRFYGNGNKQTNSAITNIFYLHSEKVRLFKENENIILIPINSKPNANELRGMFNDRKISTTDLIAQKANN